MSSSDSSPRLRPNPPHIRLNSGTVQPDLSGFRPNASRPPALAPAPSRPLLSSRHGLANSAPSPTFARAGYPQSDSTEHLLPPARPRHRRFRDDDSPLPSPALSGPSSRRTSWSEDSDHNRDSRHSPFGSPFDDSRAPSRAGSDDDNYLNTQTVSERYNILPSAGLLLFPEDVEKDDWLHNPDQNEKDARDCDVFTRRGLVNLGGLAFIVLGIFFLFIGLPILYGVPLSSFGIGLSSSRSWILRVADCAHQGRSSTRKSIPPTAPAREIQCASTLGRSRTSRAFARASSIQTHQTRSRSGRRIMERSRLWWYVCWRLCCGLPSLPCAVLRRVQQTRAHFLSGRRCILAGS